MWFYIRVKVHFGFRRTLIGKRSKGNMGPSLEFHILCAKSNNLGFIQMFVPGTEVSIPFRGNSYSVVSYSVAVL